MADFFYRTEDLRPEEILEYYVDTPADRAIVDELKDRKPTILIGSRGVGKSFLLRTAEAELLESLEEGQVLPVYLSFTRSSLIQTSDKLQFRHWMIARISNALLRTLGRSGLLTTIPTPNPLTSLAKSDGVSNVLEDIIQSYETSWKGDNSAIDSSAIPNVDTLRDAIEDICVEAGLRRIIILIDEAAHILLPAQQREFFTLFRDLRSPYLTVKAAVYPGVTAYGETFQPSHDAVMIQMNRDVLSRTYVDEMRDIVAKQADSSLLRDMQRNGKNVASRLD